MPILRADIPAGSMVAALAPKERRCIHVAIRQVFAVAANHCCCGRPLAGRVPADA